MEKEKVFFMVKYPKTDAWDKIIDKKDIPEYKEHIRKVTGFKKIHSKYRELD